MSKIITKNKSISIDNNTSNKVINDEISLNIQKSDIENINKKPISKNNINYIIDNIKEIKLNEDNITKNGNNSNENIFEEKLEISNIEIITKDDNRLGHEMFLRIMENDMLRDVPVSLQSNKMIQEEIIKKVEQLYQLKKKEIPYY